MGDDVWECDGLRFLLPAVPVSHLLHGATPDTFEIGALEVRNGQQDDLKDVVRNVQKLGGLVLAYKVGSCLGGPQATSAQGQHE